MEISLENSLQTQFNSACFVRLTQPGWVLFTPPETISITSQGRCEATPNQLPLRKSQYYPFPNQAFIGNQSLLVLEFCFPDSA